MSAGLIFTYALAYGGGLVALLNPYVGLLIYVCFSILRPEMLWPWSVPSGNYSRIVAVCMLLGWALRGFRPFALGRARWVAASLFGYWLWTTLSATWSMDHERAMYGVDTLTKIVLPCLMGILTIDSVPKAKQMAWVIVGSMGYLAYEFNLSYFSGYNRLWVEGFGAMDNNCNAIALVTCFGMAFFLGMDAEKWWLKAAAFAAAGLMAHAILFSFSRGGMLALIVTGGVSFLLLPKQPKHYALFLVAVLVVARLAGPSVLERLGSTFETGERRDSSAQSRLDLWAACWDQMQKHPLGLGVEQFPLVVDQYGFPRGKEAHTLWLQVGAEVGFPGLALLALFYGACLVRLWPIARGWRQPPDPWLPTAARMIIAALIGFSVSAQFVSLKYLEVPYYVAMLGAAVVKLCPSGAEVVLSASCPFGPGSSSEWHGSFGTEARNALGRT